MSSAAPAPSQSITGLAVTPQGHLRVLSDDSGFALDRRVAKAFAGSVAEGLLELAAVELPGTLPPSLSFWRSFGRALLTATVRAEAAGPSAPPGMTSAQTDVAAFLAAAPPMEGGEYLTAEVLLSVERDLASALAAARAPFDGDLERYLASKSRVWSSVGRVHFHLAENKSDPDRPFAFLATYTSSVSHGGRLRHLPLGKALEEYAAKEDRAALIGLLAPVDRASKASAFLKDLVDSQRVFRPIAFSPDDAYRFLRDVPAFEQAGVVVKVPDWWKPRGGSRPRVSPVIGSAPGSAIGLDALLDFHVEATLDGEALSPAELRALLDGPAAATLVRLRGRWVELDREKLSAALEHWKRVERGAADGLSFVEGMRLLAGVPADGAGTDAEAVAQWTHARAGEWLSRALAELRADGEGADPGDALKASLRPYQRAGVRWLYTLNRLGLGGCLADDMGLGKTVQVIALLLLLQRDRGCPAAESGDGSPRRPHLLVVPASLLANWQAELARFAPSLKVAVAHPAYAPEGTKGVDARALAGADVVITTYGGTYRFEAVSGGEWDLVVLDEAQAIKNASTRQTKAVKALAARRRLALTGTPIENRLGDLWSLFDFVNPGLLGTATEFSRLTKRLAASPDTGYAPLKRLVAPYLLRRLKTDRTVIADLPEKTELQAFCALSREQAKLYAESVEALARRLKETTGLERRGAVLQALMRLKQICNHPSQWTGDGGFEPERSGKYARLAELAETIASRQEKVLVFTQFAELVEPLADALAKTFGAAGLTLKGDTAVRKRQELVTRFQDEAGPPFFVLSLKAGGTGLNLTAASHVVHFDRWWNPAVEDQATDRAYRIGQRKNVLVHKFVCRGTLEEKIDAMLAGKSKLAKQVLEAGGEVPLTELDDEALLQVVRLDLGTAMAAE